MNAAIIGLPQTGKSTLFAAATGVSPNPAEMPQLKRAVVHVPDARLAPVAKLFRSKKATPASIGFLDFPGFSLADAQGRHEFSRYLPDMRQADMLVLVLRDYGDPGVPSYRDRIDPAAELAEVWEELALADLEITTKRVERLEKSLKKPTSTHDQEQRELALLTRCQGALEESQPVASAVKTPEEATVIAAFSFLTEKPLIVVQNVAEDRAAEPVDARPAHAHAAVKLSAKVEADIAELDESDRRAFLDDLGLETSARDRLIQACYEAMGYITFFTANPTEARAWAFPSGSTALEAAGKVHSDLARGFIRAETVAFDDLMEAGDYKSAKAAGKVRQEGKTYLVQDGDVLLIRFNV